MQAAVQAGSEAHGRQPGAGRGHRRTQPARRCRTSPTTWARCASCSTCSSRRPQLMRLLDVSSRAEGVRIYIGGESQVVPFEELSVVSAPYEVDGRIVGTLGVIGPTRMAYDRMIQIVDITSRLVGNALSLEVREALPTMRERRAVSSVGQSRGLIILWSLVRAQHGLPKCASSSLMSNDRLTRPSRSSPGSAACRRRSRARRPCDTPAAAAAPRAGSAISAP